MGPGANFADGVPWPHKPVTIAKHNATVPIRRFMSPSMTSDSGTHCIRQKRKCSHLSS